MTGRTETGIGASLPRLEDLPLLLGKGKYFADLKRPGQLHVFFLRSIHAHARIKSIDTRHAEELPGVVAVVTGDMIKNELLPLPQPSVTADLPGRKPTFWPLAVNKVIFHGEPVVAVVAEDPYVAEDALELIEVDYEPLPYVGDMEAALSPASPIVHDGWDSNQIFHIDFHSDRSESEHKEYVKRVAELIETAPHVIKQRYRVHRCGVTPMEPRGVLAEWDDTDGLMVWITSQRPHMDRYVFADVMSLPVSKVRVVAPVDQGGGFGVKAAIYREPMLITYLAKKLRRPVRWLETREENLMTVGQERDQIHDLELAADEDGKIIAARDMGMADAGDGCAGMYWGYNMPLVGAARFPNAFDIPFCEVQMRVAVTNKAVLSPARGLGIYPTRFALDRAIDMMARKIGMEPSDLRRKNLITELPAKLSTGITYDSGDFRKTYDRLIELANLPTFRKEQEIARKEGRYIGFGIGVGAEPSGVHSRRYIVNTGTPAYAATDVRIDHRGGVTVYYGDAPHGQSHKTVIAQVVSSELGVPPQDVTVIYGDTQTTPYSTGTVAARGASLVMSSVAVACRELRQKMIRIFAHDHKANPEYSDYEFSNGQVRHKTSDNLRSGFAELAYRIVVNSIDLPPGETGSLEQKAVFENDFGMVAFSAHGAFVEVCSKTGRIKILKYITSDDAGVVLNPQILVGQIEGGVIQGISNFLFEEYVYDENGQQFSTTLSNYKIASAADVPAIDVYHDAGSYCPNTPLGARAMGEGCIGAVPGALGNAISDALQPFGVEIVETPVTPAKILKLIRG